MINILMNQKPGLTDSVSCPTMEIPGHFAHKRFCLVYMLRYPAQFKYLAFFLRLCYAEDKFSFRTLRNWFFKEMWTKMTRNLVSLKYISQ